MVNLLQQPKLTVTVSFKATNLNRNLHKNMLIVM